MHTHAQYTHSYIFICTDVVKNVFIGSEEILEGHSKLKAIPSVDNQHFSAF